MPRRNRLSWQDDRAVPHRSGSWRRHSSRRRSLEPRTHPLLQPANFGCGNHILILAAVAIAPGSGRRRVPISESDATQMPFVDSAAATELSSLTRTASPAGSGGGISCRNPEPTVSPSRFRSHATSLLAQRAPAAASLRWHYARLCIQNQRCEDSNGSQRSRNAETHVAPPGVARDPRAMGRAH
jgi:hypothetical protein